MSDSLNQTTAAPGERKQDKIIDLRPTLFIGVGGTGMQVLMRVRRRVLNTLWGGAGNRTRIEGLADFPIAQFIHFDIFLCAGARPFAKAATLSLTPI